MDDIDGGLDGRLAEGTQVKGTLTFERAVQIDGKFEGQVKSPGKLILGETAQVDAEISVGELEVRGTLRGTVEAKNLLLIRAGGVVEADIVTDKLAIESGAIFRGACEMPEQEKLPEPKAEAQAKPAATAGAKPASPKPSPAPAVAAPPIKGPGIR